MAIMSKTIVNSPESRSLTVISLYYAPVGFHRAASSRDSGCVCARLVRARRYLGVIIRDTRHATHPRCCRCSNVQQQQQQQQQPSTSKRACCVCRVRRRSREIDSYVGPYVGQSHSCRSASCRRCCSRTYRIRRVRGMLQAAEKHIGSSAAAAAAAWF